MLDTTTHPPGTFATATDASPVERAMAHVSGVTDQLEAALDELATRLRSVLSPASSKPSDRLAQDDNVVSPLVDQLGSHLRHVDRLFAMTADLLGRLEV